MKQFFFNFNFPMFYFSLTILGLVFFTIVLSITLVILHMSGMGKKIGEIGTNVVTGLVEVDAALNLGKIFLGNKDYSTSKLAITTLIIPLINILPTLVIRVVKELKTVSLFFSQYKSSFQQQYSFFIFSLLSYLGKDIPQEMESLFNFTSSILLLTIAAFFCFIRIVLYILSVYYIEKYHLYEKFPKYKKWIRHFEKFRAYSIVY